MPKFLIPSFHPTFQDFKSGGEERIFLLSQALAENHDVVILSIGLTNRLDIVQHGNVKEFRLSKEQFLAAYSSFATEYEGYLSLPSAIAAFSNPEILAEISQLRLEPDIVLHQYPCSSSLVSFYKHATHIYNSQNFETKLCAQLIHGLDNEKQTQVYPTLGLLYQITKNSWSTDATLLLQQPRQTKNFFRLCHHKKKF